ncbi:MAG: hypothetical protein C4548_12675 [Desulfobacteraceae bacterium]|jgi:hypothetical protein|nr:MAG: hypothetical protein C4548_12675 [Desulfobacteraceae bacterium]
MFSALLCSCPELINPQPAGMTSGRSPVYKYSENLHDIRKETKKRLKIEIKKFINNFRLLI